ncbi:recombinase family protein [Streptomyces bambusae]|uniref:recombinase family protein n=1 Tax=Streptomyces bambusae TaxID=1550616 RepID=UPI0027E1E105|nr:recombinase family protein [Streptomyces bambusae]
MSANDRLPTLALLRAGVDRDNIHVDTASGAKASRPKLDLVMQLLREGDTLKVTRLDRLSRFVLHLVTLGAELREHGIGLHVIEQGIDTSTMEGRAMFGMLSVLAELQRELIVANTNDGLASASRARGRVGGRRPKLTADQAALAQQLYDARERIVQRSPTCSACRGQRCTDTSTRTRPCRVSRRRPPPRSRERHWRVTQLPTASFQVSDIRCYCGRYYGDPHTGRRRTVVPSPCQRPSSSTISMDAPAGRRIGLRPSVRTQLLQRKTRPLKALRIRVNGSRLWV